MEIAHKMGAVMEVSNPISGEVGAAAPDLPQKRPQGFPVSNPISGEVGAAARSWLMRSRQ